MSVDVAIGLGSNLGPRARNLQSAVRELDQALQGLEVSSVWETRPEGSAEEEPDYLNACCVGRTELRPRALLTFLQGIERAAGRPRQRPANAPRIIDLDLLLYGEDMIDEPGLVVPHPRMRNRAFVLLPLAEIAERWRVPLEGKVRTVGELAGLVQDTDAEPTDVRIEVL